MLVCVRAIVIFIFIFVQEEDSSPDLEIFSVERVSPLTGSEADVDV